MSKCHIVGNLMYWLKCIFVCLVFLVELAFLFLCKMLLIYVLKWMFFISQCAYTRMYKVPLKCLLHDIGKRD